MDHQKRGLSFPLENSVLDYVKGKTNSFRVGVAENEFLQNVGDKLSEIEWGYKSMVPTCTVCAQCIHLELPRASKKGYYYHPLW